MIELNKIYCQNCLDTMARMPDNFIDLTVTSPPYDNLRKYNGYSFDFEAIAKELYRVTKPGGVVVWVVSDATINGSETGTSFKQALYFKDVCGFSLYDTMVYQKIGTPTPQRPEIRYYHCFEYMFVFCKGEIPSKINLIHKNNQVLVSGKKVNSKTQRNGGKYKGIINQRLTSPLPNVWLIDASTGTNESSIFHPASFPEIIPQRHIFTWSNENDIVYDPFCGSGTTPKMAHLQKRRWIASEISSEYVELANKRLQPYLNQLTLEL